jgi:iron complex outermembrane receptor protein
MRVKLSLSTSILALICCSAVHAQSAGTSSGSSSTSASSGTIEEVVVTAERRTVSLQKTNIAATVLSGQDLANKGVMSVNDLQFIAPDVTINNFGQGIDFDIRGIGKGEHNSQTTPGVITYRDGVATFPGYFTEEPYYDIGSVEVLRGSQGTFAGQNAIGGAVFVTTNNPVIGGGFDGYAQAQVGNYSDFGLQGAVNVPIDDTMAGRVAFYSETRDSFYSISDPLAAGGKYTGNPGDAHWGAPRFSLLWQPTQSLTILLKTDADLLDNGAYPADPYTDRFKYIPGTTTPNPFYTGLFNIRANAPQLGQDEFVRTSLKVDYVFGDGITLQSISAFQYGNSSYKADLYGSVNPGGPPTVLNPYPSLISTDTYSFGDMVDESIWSEEINLISRDTGFFTWILGGYAQSDLYDFLSPASRGFYITTPPFGSITLSGSNPNTDLSAFAQGTFNLPAGFQIQLGGRYSATTTENRVGTVIYGFPLPDLQSASANNFSYKAALNWNVNDDNLLYAFLATGFKPGGLNLPGPFGLPAPFTPETVTDYEAGWKSSFFDGHVHTQIDGFYDNFRDFQVIIGYPALPVISLELNDPNPTKLYGFEAEAQAVFGALSFDGGIGLLHSSLGTFYATDPRVASFAPCSPTTGPSSASCFNLAGHEQTYAPNFTLNLGAQYEFNLGGGDTLTPRVNFSHQSAQWATLFENSALGDRLAQRNILNAQLAWNRGDWTVTLYGTNLTDDQYVAALNTNLDFAGPPRQFGIRLTKAF